jgi:hypothetical protein
MVASAISSKSALAKWSMNYNVENFYVASDS